MAFDLDDEELEATKKLNGTIVGKSVLELPKYKSIVNIGTLKVATENHFNWFQKRMWNKLLGVTITDITEE